MEKEKATKWCQPRWDYLSPKIKVLSINVRNVLCQSNMESMTRSNGEWDDEEE